MGEKVVNESRNIIMRERGSKVERKWDDKVTNEYIESIDKT